MPAESFETGFSPETSEKEEKPKEEIEKVAHKIASGTSDSEFTDREKEVKAEYREEIEEKLNKLKSETEAGKNIEEIKLKDLARKIASEEKSWSDLTPEEEDLAAEQREELEKYLRGLKKDKETKEEKEKTREEVIAEIKEDLSDQPESIRDMVKHLREEWNLELEDVFREKLEVENMEFLLSPNMDGGKRSVFSLVKEKSDSGEWKFRSFRYSDSGKQWKAVPGKNGSKYLKTSGSEDGHYVQGAKLHKKIYKKIDNLPEDNQPGTSRLNGKMESFLPNKDYRDDEELNGYWEEFEFKENPKELKDPEWKEAQTIYQLVYEYYKYMVRGAKDKTLKEYYEWDGGKADLSNMKEKCEKYKDDPEVSKKMGEKSIKEIHNNPEENPKLAEILKAYKKDATRSMEGAFSKNTPESMIPDFSETNIIDSYLKEQGRDEIKVEEYKVESGEGDELIFAMARDESGRIFVDNVYDRREGVDSYGTPERMVDMGYLVYKPIDYRKQIEPAISDKNLEEASNKSDRYVDISKLWENNEIIKRYKEELKERGEL